MKLKIKWKQNEKYVSGRVSTTYEYLETPFGRITITLTSDTNRYEQPYNLSIPGCEDRFFATPVAAKEFAEGYLLRETAKMIDLTPPEQPSTTCTSNT